MPLRFGPGPVFIHESIAATRRWQLYALRSFFVLGLLLALALVLCLVIGEAGTTHGGAARSGCWPRSARNSTTPSRRCSLFWSCSVAPAATAGAICVDRARGTLTHMLVTDLTDSEIVLGKLAARLLPVFALVGATVPVLALAGLLGGIIIEAIATLTLITFALAVLGCALALAFSVRATKVHEVLMAVYGIEAVWIVGATRLVVAGGCRGRARASCLVPGHQSLRSGLGALRLDESRGNRVLCSGRWAQRSSCRRDWSLLPCFGSGPSATKGTGVRATKVSSWISRARAWVQARRPGPSLDDDPVLWREWRRGRPSRLARIIWGFYFALASGRHGMERLFRHHLQPLRCGHHRAGERLSGHIRPAAREHDRADRAGRGARTGQPRCAHDDSPFDRSNRPGEVVGSLPGRAGAGVLAGTRSAHRRLRAARDPFSVHP